MAKMIGIRCQRCGRSILDNGYKCPHCGGFYSKRQTEYAVLCRADKFALIEQIETNQGTERMDKDIEYFVLEEAVRTLDDAQRINS